MLFSIQSLQYYKFVGKDFSRPLREPSLVSIAIAVAD